MKLTKVQKIMSGTVIGVMMLTASAGAVFDKMIQQQKQQLHQFV